MAKLTLSMDGLVLREITLTKERTTIGRKPHNDVQIDNLAVSGEHAVIVTILSDSFLEDLGSTNGTMVNGQPIKKHFLQNGDTIDIGKYRLKYIANDASAGPKPPEFEKTILVNRGTSPSLPDAPLGTGMESPLAGGFGGLVGTHSTPPSGGNPFGGLADLQPGFALPGRSPTGPHRGAGVNPFSPSGPQPVVPAAGPSPGAGFAAGPLPEPPQTTPSLVVPPIEGNPFANAARAAAAPGGDTLLASGPHAAVTISQPVLPPPATSARPLEPASMSVSQAMAAPLSALAAVQILTGSNAGRELELVKPLTTLGKPQVQVAVITRRPNGYYITHVEGHLYPIVNGRPLDAQAHPLKDHDIIEIAGVKMEFYFKG